MTRSRSGSTAVEFALCLPFVFAILAAITDLSVFLSELHNIDRACRDAARVGAATLDASPPIGDDIEAAALEQASAVLTAVNLDPSLAATSARWRVESDGYAYVTVSVTYPFFAPVGIFPSLNGGVRSNFTMMTLQQP